MISIGFNIWSWTLDFSWQPVWRVLSVELGPVFLRIGPGRP